MPMGKASNIGGKKSIQINDKSIARNLTYEFIALPNLIGCLARDSPAGSSLKLIARTMIQLSKNQEQELKMTYIFLVIGLYFYPAKF